LGALLLAVLLLPFPNPSPARPIPIPTPVAIDSSFNLACHVAIRDPFRITTTVWQVRLAFYLPFGSAALKQSWEGDCRDIFQFWQRVTYRLLSPFD